MKVLIVHSDLDARGGAESYAGAVIRVCESHGLNVQVVDIDTVATDLSRRTLPWRIVGRSLRRIRKLEALTWACVLRYVRWLHERADPDWADLVIFTYGECGDMPFDHARILHCPAMYSTERRALARLGTDTSRPTEVLLRQAYVRCCRLVGNSPQVEGEKCLLTIANSRWTASERPNSTNQVGPTATVYPPVSPRKIDLTESRSSNRIVAVGRLVANKRHREAISIVEAAARRTKCDLSLTIVGRGEGRYVRELAQFAQQSGVATVIPNASDRQLDETMSRARFGLHTYQSEHFGIAIAEMILAGCIPVVHDDGGAVELIPDPRCRFRSDEQAVECVESLVKLSLDEQEQIQAVLQSTPALVAAVDFEARFGVVLQRLIAEIESPVNQNS